MPEQETIERAQEDAREGKSPSTQAGEFVREEIHHIREGKHGARSPEQAIAIGLSKAWRAGVKLPPPPKGSAARKSSRKTTRAAKGTRKRPSVKRSRAMTQKLKQEGRKAASPRSLSRHAKQVAKRRPAKARSASAKKAARTRARTRRSS